MLLPRLSGGIRRKRYLVPLPANQLGSIVPRGTCGRSWNEPWVRDTYGNADFTDACRNHDRCYETCGRSKDDCDSTFHGELRDVCRSAYPSPWHVVHRNACLSIADAYHSAVHRMGGDAYRAAQRDSGCG